MALIPISQSSCLISQPRCQYKYLKTQHVPQKLKEALKIPQFLLTFYFCMDLHSSVVYCLNGKHYFFVSLLQLNERFWEDLQGVFNCLLLFLSWPYLFLLSPESVQCPPNCPFWISPLSNSPLDFHSILLSSFKKQPANL